MAKVAIRGAELIDPERREPARETLLLEDGRIAGRLPADRTPDPAWRIVDRPGRRVSPGFIDLHFHGELVASPPGRFADALARDAARMLAEGATAFLATSVCWPQQAFADSVEALARASRGTWDGAACLGLHLEGPWISPDAPGAMAPDAIRPFDPGGDAEVLLRADERLRMVTLAPEVPGADALIDVLVARDVVPAMGHTRASAGCVETAVSRGLRHVTHLWNAMGPLHHRAPGAIGAALADERLSCDLICDGHHVHPAVVRATARALGERMLLITDRIALPPSAVVPSALGDAEPGPDGAPWQRADGTLVGSQLGLDRAVDNAHRFAGIALGEAVAACTLRPARLLGVERDRGTLRPGARADLAMLDETGRAVETWVAGVPRWSAAKA